ncbi:MAG: hypothetical protein ACK48Y_02045, partial [Planctomyces sp.]
MQTHGGSSEQPRGTIMAATAAARILRSIPVGRQASESLRATVPSGNLKSFAREYRRLLEGPARRQRKLQRDESAALWSADDAALSARERALAAGLRQYWQSVSTGRQKARHRKDLEKLMAGWSGSLRQSPGSWEALAVAELLLLQGEFLEPATFAACIAVLARLKSASAELVGLAANSPPQATMEAAYQSETAFIVALLLNPLAENEALLGSACMGLQQMLQNGTDESGRPHGSLLPVLSGFLSVMARSAAWSTAFRQSFSSPEL